MIIDYDRLRRTVYHGLPRPDLPTQDHDVFLLLTSMFDRLDALEADILALIDEAEEEEEEAEEEEAEEEEAPVEEEEEEEEAPVEEEEEEEEEEAPVEEEEP